jgi:DNA-damage-inducible protein J
LRRLVVRAVDAHEAAHGLRDEIERRPVTIRAGQPEAGDVAAYNIRLDPAVKANAEEIFAAFGLNLSDAINVFLHIAIKQRGFPFEIREPKLKAETLLAMEETEQILDGYANGSRIQKSFSNARDMFAAMDLEDEAEGNYE